MQPRPPAAEALHAAPPAERVAACQATLAAARDTVRERHRAGASGVETSAAWAHAVDGVVRELLHAADDGTLPPLALVAVGGYGRAELCPGSDLDLWFITPRPSDARVGRLAEEVLYPLWDLKLQVGHAVRSVDDSVALGREDLTAGTALLDTRLVAGDPALHAALVAEARRQLFEREPAAFVRQLVAEKSERHARFGDTVFLLEPDVKNGQGGYRDLLVSLWAAKARFRAHCFRDLLALGQATERQVAALAAAHDFFLRVRTAAHLAARRRQDRLLFEIQESIAPDLFGESPAPPPALPPETLAQSIRPSVAPAVEALMRSYYLHAKAVEREGNRLLERCAEPPARRPQLRKVDGSFVLWNSRLSTSGPEVFRDRPSEMIRIFRVALDLGAELYGHTRELIAEACHQPETALALARDPTAAEHFRALLVDERDRRSPSLLEQMHDLGLLTALMPEFAPCTARVQHDLYHVFTVDQHSLYAVGRLKALARGELAAELPVATAAMRECERKLALYLGTLLHDVGKPLGKGHSEKGARLAVSIARRLRLSEEATAHVEQLVLLHLVMAHLSQRRDLGDVAMIARFAEDLGDEETVRTLYLLTLADMSMVAPGNLTTWKEQLLRELYVRALAHLRRGPDLAGTDRSSLVARRKARAAALLGETEAALGPWFGGLPDRYFAQTTPPLIARHVVLSRRRAEAGGALSEAGHHPRKGWSELSVLADDTPGVLARIAGVLLANKADVLSAQIASRKRDGAGEAIDVFLVRDRYGRALGESRAATLAADLRRVLSGELAVEKLIEERRERSTLKPRVTPRVATEIKIDNEVSGDYTVFDIYTQDRPGVLYTITHTLSALGLDIGLSKVATEADRVADIFYVRDSAGAKLGRATVDKAQGALIEALAQLSASDAERP